MMASLNADSSDDESVLVSRATHLHSQSSGEEDNILDNIQEEESGDKGSTSRQIASSSEDEHDNKIKGKGVAKTRRVLDSSDEEGENASPSQSQNKSQGLFMNKDVFDAESSDDESVNDKLSDTKKDDKKRHRLAADSSDDDENTAHQGSSDRRNKIRADSSDDSDVGRPEHSPSRSSNSEGENRLSETELSPSSNSTQVKRKQSPKSRKSKSNAMSEIRSESQRLLRESPFQLPYHKPKQRSLEEFLNRKKGTPEIIHSIKEKTFSVADENRQKAREKQLEEFYKDEDENEADDEGDEKEEQVEMEQINEKIDNTEVIKNDLDQVEPGQSNSEAIEANSAAIEANSDVTAANCAVTTADNEVTEADSETTDVNSETIKPNCETIEGKNDVSQETSQNDTETVCKPAEGNDNLDIEPEKEKPCSESLDLMLEETPEIVDSTILDSSQMEKKQRKMEALRKQYGDNDFEKTLNITPKLGSKDDDFFAPKSTISSGAEKLFNTFVHHVQASSHEPNKLKSDNNEVNIVVRSKDSSGNDVFKTEKVKINDNKIPEPKGVGGKKLTLLEMKKQLKKEVMAKKLQDMKLKAEMIKLNNEEFDELPDEEDEEEAWKRNMDHVVDEEEDMDEDGLDDEEEGEEDDELEDEEDESEEYGHTKERKANRNLFVDEEAEVSEDSDDESETESLHLVQEDDDRHQQKSKKNSSGYKRIKNPDNFSDDSSPLPTDQPSEMETPNMETASIHSLAGSTVSSSSSIFNNTVPRWTPFKDRLPVEPTLQHTTQSDQIPSPTSSQMTKKRLGFEDLCDDNDPDVDDVSDLLGLCSGKFATQLQPKADLIPDTQQMCSDGPEISKSLHLETQDTLILTGNSSRGTTPLPEKLAGLKDLLDKEIMESDNNDYPPLFEDLPAEAGMRILDSDDEDSTEVKNVDRKRKRVVISDDENADSDDNDNDAVDDSENEDSDVDAHGEENDDDVEEDEEMEAERKESKARKMFDVKGRLKKDFFDAEAELSGSEEELSDDEDEKGLDRLELEEGDYDEIDEREEQDKVGRIYHKNLLDQDQADLKLFQERFLEDGDLHSDNKRQRQFKWKGLDDSLEVDRRVSDGEEEGDGDDMGEGEQWRIQRLEREKWMKENRENHEAESESQFFQIGAKALAKVNSSNSPSLQSTQSSQSSGPLQPLNVTKLDQRSSFLSRGHASLESLSVFAKRVDDRSGTGAKKGKNFVFTLLSPQKTGAEPDPENSAEETAQPVKPKMKKPTNPPKKQKIDRSLSSDARPSIFNFF